MLEPIWKLVCGNFPRWERGKGEPFRYGEMEPRPSPKKIARPRRDGRSKRKNQGKLVGGRESRGHLGGILEKIPDFLRVEGSHGSLIDTETNETIAVIELTTTTCTRALAWAGLVRFEIFSVLGHDV